jgi:hypothetical protein
MVAKCARTVNRRSARSRDPSRTAAMRGPTVELRDELFEAHGDLMPTALRR